MSDETGPIFVPASHPSLPGHFPGRPVVPGVVILDLVLAEWRRIHPGQPVCGLKKMKFVSPLQPDQRIMVTWGEVRDGKAPFKALADDKMLASGQFVLD
jgi:3-hydroxymyristoyl/3-hydroxydecanoyl-(acyl carrier protein) dehydratase